MVSTPIATDGLLKSVTAGPAPKSTAKTQIRSMGRLAIQRPAAVRSMSLTLMVDAQDFELGATATGRIGGKVEVSGEQKTPICRGALA